MQKNEKTCLEVHISVGANQEPLIFQPPFELDIDRLSCQFLNKRLRVDWIDLDVPKIVELDENLERIDAYILKTLWSGERNKEHVRTSKVRDARSYKLAIRTKWQRQISPYIAHIPAVILFASERQTEHLSISQID